MLAAASNMLAHVRQALQRSAPGVASTGGAQEEMENDEVIDEEASASNVLQHYLDCNEEPGLDAHPDMHISAIWLYKLKRQNEFDRNERRRQVMEAAGYSEEEIEERMRGKGESGANASRDPPLRVLEQAGARLRSMSLSADASAHAARASVDRNLRGYLTKQSIDATRHALPEEAPAAAFTAARDTAMQPLIRNQVNREQRSKGLRLRLKGARAVLRERGSVIMRDIKLKRKFLENPRASISKGQHRGSCDGFGDLSQLAQGLAAKVATKNVPLGPDSVPKSSHRGARPGRLSPRRCGVGTGRSDQSTVRSILTEEAVEDALRRRGKTANDDSYDTGS